MRFRLHEYLLEFLVLIFGFPAVPEVPINLDLLVRPAKAPFSRGLAQLLFSDFFYMKLGFNKNINMMESIFGRKVPITPKLGHIAA